MNNDASRMKKDEEGEEEEEEVEEKEVQEGKEEEDEQGSGMISKLLSARFTVKKSGYQWID